MTMTLIGQILSSVAALGGLVCFILVLIQMFKHGKTGLGITCIVLFWCCGIGYLITFIYGWVVSREWSLTPVMLVWTVCWVLGIVGHILNPIDFSQFQQFQRP
jgi:hypothetical protein